MIVFPPGWKVVFVCSPYRSDDPEEFEKFAALARDATRFVALMGRAPITIHRYLPGALDDDKETEREMAFAIGRELISRADALWVFKDYGVSSGMQYEIDFAKQNGIPVKFWPSLPVTDTQKVGPEAP